jgi:hypothetical protein
MALAEGDADMSLLLPRSSRVAVLTLALLTVISLPTLRIDRTPGSALTPSIAWAGGSPDETLKPPDSPPTTTPPKSAAITRIGYTGMNATTIGTNRSTMRLTALQRWQLFVSVFRTFATRF